VTVPAARPATHLAHLSRRQLVGATAGLAVSCASARELRAASHPAPKPVMVGSTNGLPGMEAELERLAAGGSPLDAAIAVCKVAEADPTDTSVGLGGIPNEDGVVQLDAACMDGRTHNSGAVAAIENILHPIEVARLVMERTDHCQIFGAGAYRFAREHGHPHAELLTEETRRTWLRWKENLSTEDDRLPPPPEPDEPKSGALPGRFERHGTIHCSVLALDGNVACATSTSGLGYKIPGRVGDSAIVGAGLFCDAEGGSAGSTGRGEASILACASAVIVELMRSGRTPKDAGMEVLRRIAKNTERAARWQPALLGADGRPVFDIQFYVLGLDGAYAGVTMHGRSRAKFAVADASGGARLEPLEALFS
jgi:N4-(beta-N-acetylglucosaminyl)-L-asparaginase